MDLYRWLPPEGVKIALVLVLSFLIGLEREEHNTNVAFRSFGGVRTFPLIGLIGYALALLSGGELLPLTLGFAVVGGFLMISYRYKLSASGLAGVTTEMSGLATYLVGALVYHEQFWIATTVCVASVLLLELKDALEGLTKRVPREEVLTLTKFLLITAVVLPVLPNQEFGPFHINPFRTWLVVVAVSSVSYGSYVIQRMTEGGLILAAMLGGAYSSTVTTVALSRRAKKEDRPHFFSGATLVASGVMYLRLAALLALFNRSLLVLLGPAFIGLAALAIGAGWLWSRRPDPESSELKQEYQPRNPLEMRGALLFALLFVAMLIVTGLVVGHLGKAGAYALAALMGVSDVDPFIMGMTQSAGSTAPIPVAAAAILIAAASNNLIKGIYAFSLSGRETGVRSLAFLAGLAVLGLVPLLWVGMGG